MREESGGEGLGRSALEDSSEELKQILEEVLR